MHLPRSQRKLIVLFTRFAELYKSKDPLPLGEVSVTTDGEPHIVLLNKDKKIIEEFPVSERVLKKWRTKITPHKEKLQEIDATVIRWFPGKWKDITDPISDPEKKLPLFKFAEKIGIDASKARYLIDRQFAHDLPTFSSLTSSNTIACNFVREFGGIYYLYRHDNNMQTRTRKFSQGVLLKCTVSIRYPVPYSPLDSERNGFSRVRCKVNIPSINRQLSEPFKYDGYVSKKGKKWLHWLLQMRPDRSTNNNDNDDDLVLMYTERPKPDTTGNIVACGIMVTQNQDKDLMPTISTICMIKEKNYKLNEEHVLSGTASASIKKLSESSGTYFKGSPEDEKRIMRNKLAVIDLSASSTWNEIDKLAVEKIFYEGVKVNLKGLHT